MGEQNSANNYEVLSKGGIKISFNAIEHITQKEMDRNPEYLAKMRAKGKLYMNDVRSMDENTIIARLNQIGLEISKDYIHKIASENRSAQEACKKIYPQLKGGLSANDEDFVWLGINVLWQRWFPQIPSFEMLDDSMQAGYVFSMSGDEKDAADKWYETWHMQRKLAQRWNLPTIEQFDDEFNGTQCVFNWIQDCMDAFSNTALTDESYLLKEIEIRRETLDSGMLTDERTAKSFKGTLAQTLIRSGQVVEGDAAFEDLISNDPKWPWYYIWWADAYSFFRKSKSNDYLKALGILKRGLSANVLSDEDVLQGRLDSLLKEMRVADDKYPLSQTAGKIKVGRNEQCPCGSGKKYKHCCGRSA
jgi:hypothetical protein